MQLAPGAVFGGKYQIERALARGGMGSVWVARHVQLGSTVAVKFLDAGFAASPAHRARFEREARASASIKSPHVVQVQDYGFEGDVPYLVMELLEGEDLAQRLRRVRRLSIPDTARLLAQIGKALRKAHEMSIVHRDLKPANLFLARVDDEEIVKILDFGIAKEQGAPIGDATRTGEVVGSPHYMSPEQVRAERDLDGRTDLWSVGVILYRALVGVLPFPGDQMGPVLAKILTDPIPLPTQLAPDLPLSMNDFFLRALARDRQQRFQTIAEMVDAFQLAAGGKEALGSISMSVGTGAVPAAQLPGPGGTSVLTTADFASGPIGGSGAHGIGGSGAHGIGGSGAHGIGGSGAHGIGGSGVTGISGVTGSGLAHTGVAPARSQGPLIAIVAVGCVLALASAGTALFLWRSSASGAAASGDSVSAAVSDSATAASSVIVAPAAATPTLPVASATASASATGSAPIPSSVATTAQPATSGAPSPSASAKSQGGSWKPPKPKEKWF
jgi:serine/threonine-protein kinase